MRIIGGNFRGRHITAPAGLPVRPTTDFAKTALFNILVNRYDLDEVRVLDLFGGTGNISFEFASRGCADITCVDQNHKCVEFVRKTATVLNFSGLKVIRADALWFIKNPALRWDIIFADPPYDFGRTAELPNLILKAGLLTGGGSFILEHDRRHRFEETPGFEEQRVYGNVNFSFFRALEKEEQ